MPLDPRWIDTLKMFARGNDACAADAREVVWPVPAELDRLTSELAAAQAELTAARRGPVVEWYDGVVGERAVWAFCADGRQRGGGR